MTLELVAVVLTGLAIFIHALGLLIRFCAKRVVELLARVGIEAAADEAGLARAFEVSSSEGVLFRISVHIFNMRVHSRAVTTR